MIHRGTADLRSGPYGPPSIAPSSSSACATARSWAVAGRQGRLPSPLDRGRGSPALARPPRRPRVKVLLSDDGVGLLGVETARRTAYTSAVSGVPTAKFAAFSASPQMRVAPPHLVDANLLPVAGGRVPTVTADGEVIGAIGVGGADDTTDDRIANQARESVAKIVA
ncbi:heme-binding protein [Streptomyces sp. NPDC005483]|uniref:GlcG/HbpS family heme-binding protein n=1 Tax=Streptomyces sp. NPDC005483 TaxID=3154882 RepID=UPI0033B2B649